MLQKKCQDLSGMLVGLLQDTLSVAGNFNPDSETHYWEAGKGSRPRRIDSKKYYENFDKLVFNHDKPKNVNEKGV